MPENVLKVVLSPRKKGEDWDYVKRVHLVDVADAHPQPENRPGSHLNGGPCRFTETLKRQETGRLTRLRSKPSRHCGFS